MSRVTEIFNKFEMFEMANVSLDRSGLNYLVWISVKSGKERHGPRIKVSKDENFTSITISDIPKIKKVDKIGLSTKDFKKISQWILLNKQLLIQYWETGITGHPSTEGVLKNLKSI